MGRKATQKFPPYISLKEALSVITMIYEKMGGTASRDNLGTVFGNTPKSSSFARKAQALRWYGLLTEEGTGSYGLSPLAQRIVAPQSVSDRAAAILSALHNVELFAALHNKYKGKILPEEGYLANTIEHEFKIPAGYKSLWKKSFIESCEAAGVFRKDGVKTVVKEDAGDVEWPSEPFILGAKRMEDQPMEQPLVQALREEAWQKLEFPGIRIAIEKPLDEGKIETAKSLLDLLIGKKQKPKAT